MPRWTEEELATLRDTSLKLNEVAARLGRSLESVKARAAKPDVPRRRAENGPPFTAEEDDHIRNTFDTLKRVAALLNRPYRQVVARAAKLGVVRKRRPPRTPSKRNETGTCVGCRRRNQPLHLGFCPECNSKDFAYWRERYGTHAT